MRPGMTAAFNLTETTGDACLETERTVLHPHPHTPEGVIAQLVFAAELAAGDGEISASEIVPALINTARIIAGVNTTKIELSENIAAVLATIAPPA